MRTSTPGAPCSSCTPHDVGQGDRRVTGARDLTFVVNMDDAALEIESKAGPRQSLRGRPAGRCVLRLQEVPKALDNTGYALTIATFSCPAVVSGRNLSHEATGSGTVISPRALRLSVDQLPTKPVSRLPSRVGDGQNLHAVIRLSEHNEEGESA